jgi:SAM-dependent methyltransferase
MERAMKMPVFGFEVPIARHSRQPVASPAAASVAPLGWRARWFLAFFGIPHGPIGWVGARLLPVVAGPLYKLVVAEFGLVPGDELLDVGCGSGGLLAAVGPDVGFLAGLDASPMQVEMARERLKGRLAAGTAEIVLGDAMALPWPDGRFTAVSSLNCVKFVPEPDRAVQEMYRVLRPGGRVVMTLDPAVTDPARSGEYDVWGERQWSLPDARAMMVGAGFTDVTISELPAKYLKLLLVRAVKRG